MRSVLKKCEICGTYTLKDICSCQNPTSHAQPPRFSPQDRFGEYRRKLKAINEKERKK
jgi:H/ACA ribonucleoprotein complex subunit 3